MPVFATLIYETWTALTAIVRCSESSAGKIGTESRNTVTVLHDKVTAKTFNLKQEKCWLIDSLTQLRTGLPWPVNRRLVQSEVLGKMPKILRHFSVNKLHFSKICFLIFYKY